MVELHYREKLKEFAFIPYQDKFQPGTKVPISLEMVYKAFTEETPLLSYKENKAQHKTNYHVWNTRNALYKLWYLCYNLNNLYIYNINYIFNITKDRPLPPDLLTYAAFDVASLREILQLFLNKLKLYHWVSILAKCKSDFVKWNFAGNIWVCHIKIEVNVRAEMQDVLHMFAYRTNWSLFE